MEYEYDYDKVLAELRKVSPFSARILEDACDMTNSQELCWELVIAIALFAGQAEKEILAASSALEGMTTTMRSRRDRVMTSEVPEIFLSWMILHGFEVISVREDNSTVPASRYFTMWREEI